MFGFAVIVENGFAILALGLMTIRGYELFANMLLARMISFGLWSLSLSIIRSKVGSLDLQQNRGLARVQPLLAVSILAAQFSIGGLPLFAGFPIRISLIEELSLQSPALAWLIIIGIGGVWAGGIYSLFVFLQKTPNTQAIPFRSRVIPGLLVLGITALVFLGLFPHLVSPMVVDMLRAYPRLMSLP
jgi:formate hydrogenlyase subunit 3/multisubunit Na+/H+ antiporter MnhD subunit